MDKPNIDQRLDTILKGLVETDVLSEDTVHSIREMTKKNLGQIIPKLEMIYLASVQKEFPPAPSPEESAVKVAVALFEVEMAITNDVGAWLKRMHRGEFQRDADK